MKYSYEAMCKLNPRDTKTEQAKQLGVERATVYVYQKQFEKDKAIRIQLNEHKHLTEALGVLIPSYSISQLINVAEAGTYRLVLEDLSPRKQLDSSIDDL